MNRRSSLVVLFIITIAAGTLLLSASKILLYPLIKQPFVPAGTFITWTGLITWAYCFRLILLEGYNDEGRRPQIRKLSLIYIVPALSWGLLSYGLAGNWEYAFSSMSDGFRGSTEAGKIFWYMTYLIIGAPAITALLYVLAFRRN